MQSTRLGDRLLKIYIRTPAETNIAGKLNQPDIGEGNFNYHMMKVFHDFLIRQLYENFEKYLPRGVFL